MFVRVLLFLLYALVLLVGLQLTIGSRSVGLTVAGVVLLVGAITAAVMFRRRRRPATG